MDGPLLEKTMFTVTETIIDEMFDPIVGAGSTISEVLIADLYDTHGIDRLHLDGRWLRVTFPKDKYGRRILRLVPDFSSEDPAAY
jgi:hypothetical protein